MSRGQLVKSGRHTLTNQVLVSLIIPITKEMLPSFRVVAFYHTNDNKVVSDSIWVDVKDSCMGTVSLFALLPLTGTDSKVFLSPHHVSHSQTQLRLEPVRPAPSFEPRRMFGLRVTGDPGATVGLAAVDKGIFVLNNKHRLTQKKAIISFFTKKKEQQSF